MKINLKNIFFVLFFILLSLVFFDFFNEKKSNEEKNQNLEFITINKDQVNQLQIEFPEHNEILKINKDQDGWKIIEPFADQADNELVEELLSQVYKEKALNFIKSIMTLDQLSVYGLDKSKMNLTIINNLGESNIFSISSKVNFENNPFLLDKKNNRIFVVPAYWSRLAGMQMIDFRDRRLLRDRIAKVQKMSLTQGGKNIKLNKNTNDWFEDQNPDWKLNQNKIREFLTQISNLKGHSVVYQGVLTKFSNKENFQFNKDSMRIELVLNEKIWKCDLFKQDSGFYIAKINSPEMILKLTGSEIQNLVKFNFDELRDLNSPFYFKPDLAFEFTHESPLKKNIIIKDQSQWHLKLNPKQIDTTVVDSEKLQNVLIKIKESQALSFEVKNKKMREFLELKNVQGDVLVKLEWSDVFMMRQGPVEKEVVAMKSSLVKDLFIVEKSTIEAWELAQIYKK